MLPTNQAGSLPCSNISSNCVIWQGPDISCIDLCNGDTVSEVIAKLATELCTLVDAVAGEPSLEGLDLLCTLPSGTSAPTTVAATFQVIVDYICALSGGGSFTLPTLTLPTCLQYTDSGTGLLVTTAKLDSYAVLTANKVCDILSTIAIIQTTLTDHESRLIILENCVLPCSTATGEPDVISSCILAGSGLIPASTLLLALETAYCNLEDAVGTPSLISTAVNAQCIIGTDSLVGSTGTYGGLTGWVNSPATLAESVNNLWLVVCDMHAAITSIQLNCCPGACDSVVFLYTGTVVETSRIPTDIELLFTSSNVPTGYNDCGGTTTVAIADKVGGTTYATFNFTSYAATTTVLSVPLAGTGLNVFGGFDVTINFCVTDGDNTCNEKQIINLPATVLIPDPVTIGGIGSTTASIQFINPYGITAEYTIVVTKVSTQSIINTITLTSPGTNIDQSLGTLEAETEYSVVVTTEMEGYTSTSDAIVFTTLAA